MDPLSIGAIALGGLQVLGGLFSSPQKRPEWVIPGSAYENVASAKRLASATVRPGNQIALDDIARATASGEASVKRTAGSGSQVLAATERIAKSGQEAVVKNNALNADFNFNQQRNLQGVLSNFAQLQREKFINDTWGPYQESRQTSGALIGSGIQNLFGTLAGAQQNQVFRDYLASLRPAAGG